MSKTELKLFPQVQTPCSCWWTCLQHSQYWTPPVSCQCWNPFHCLSGDFRSQIKVFLLDFKGNSWSGFRKDHMWISELVWHMSSSGTMQASKFRMQKLRAGDRAFWLHRLVCRINFQEIRISLEIAGVLYLVKNSFLLLRTMLTTLIPLCFYPSLKEGSYSSKRKTKHKKKTPPKEPKNQKNLSSEKRGRLDFE